MSNLVFNLNSRRYLMGPQIVESCEFIIQILDGIRWGMKLSDMVGRCRLTL